MKKIKLKNGSTFAIDESNKDELRGSSLSAYNDDGRLRPEWDLPIVPDGEDLAEAIKKYEEQNGKVDAK